MSRIIAVAHATDPNVSVYRWQNGDGFGTKFSDPATIPVSVGGSVSFTTYGDTLAVTHGTTPYVSVYPWQYGFGTKFSNPATLPGGVGQGVAFTAAGDALAIAHWTTPFVTAYPWSGSGFGTKFADPSTLPANDAIGVAFTVAGNAIAVSHLGSPYVSVYPWSGSGFGTKFSNPATLPAGDGYGVAFTTAGDAIAVAHEVSPYVSVYPWSGSGFGTKFANPATLPGATRGLSVAFTTAGDALAVGHINSPYVSVYPWSGSGFGTKFANPASLPPERGTGVAFTAAGNALAVSHWTTPFVTAYPWSGSGFGTKFADPATLPAGTAYGVAFSENADAWYFGSSSNPADGAAATNTADPTAVTPPTGMLAGDLVFMVGNARIASLTLAVSQAGGQSWTAHAALSGTTKSARVFTCTFNGTWSADPSVSFGSTTCNSVQMHVFRPPATGYLWAVNQAQVSGSDATDPFAITGQTTTGVNETVTLASWFSPDDNTWGTLTGTDWQVTGTAQYRNTSGSDQSASYAHKIQAVAGATGNVGKSQLTLGADTATTSILTMEAIAPPRRSPVNSSFAVARASGY